MSNEKIKKALIELVDEYKIPYNSEAQGIYQGFIYAVGDADSYETLIKQALEEKAISRVQFGKAMDVALDIAVTLEDFSILLVLMDGNSAEDYYHAKKIALRKAAEIGCLWIVEHLVMHGADVSGNHAALIGAVEYGKKDVVKFFVSYGADIYTRWRDTDMMVHYIQCQDMDMIQFLFDQGYDICKGKKRQSNIINAAIKTKDREIVERLLANTKQPNNRMFLKNMMVCATNQRNNEMVKILLERPESDDTLLEKVLKSVYIDGRQYLQNCMLSA